MNTGVSSVTSLVRGIFDVIGAMPAETASDLADTCARIMSAKRDALRARAVLDAIGHVQPAVVQWDLTADYYDDGTSSMRLSEYRITITVGDKSVNVYDIHQGGIDLGTFDSDLTEWLEKLPGDSDKEIDDDERQALWVAERLGIGVEQAATVVSMVVDMAGEDIYAELIDLHQRAVDKDRAESLLEELEAACAGG